MTNQEFYERGYADGLANQPYDRRLSGYNYYHGFKAGRHVRRTRKVPEPRRRSRLRRWGRHLGKVVIVILVQIVRVVIAH